MCVVIFMPKDVAIILDVEQFRETQKGFLGWSLIFCVSYLIAASVWYLKNNIFAKIESYFVRKNFRRRLHELTNDEKKLLQRFIDGENTIHCNPVGGVSGGLESKGIIFSPRFEYNMMTGIPYNIHTWAKRYLTKKPDLLEIEDNEALRKELEKQKQKKLDARNKVT